MAWQSVHAVIAMDLFKIQNVNAVQSAGASGSLKMNQRKIEILSPVITNMRKKPFARIGDTYYFLFSNTKTTR
jgi:hypothetical protein